MGSPDSVGPDDDDVHEEPDELVERVVAAAGDLGADGDVDPGAVALQQRGQGRHGDHEHGGAPGRGQLAQAAVELGRDVEVDGATAAVGPRRSGPVGGQGDLLGEAGQRLPPVGQLLVGEAGVEELLVPEGVVGVADGERAPSRGPARPGGPRRR